MLLRVIVSLAAVFGLLFYLRKKLGARMGAAPSAQLRIIERKQLAAKSSLALVEVSGRRYLLGVAESSVNVLDSFEAPEIEESEEPADGQPVESQNTEGEREKAFALTLNRSSANFKAPNGLADPLAGSILSAQTWRNMREALRRTVR